MKDLKKDMRNRVFEVFGCIIALLPIESTIVYLYTLPIAVGITEIFIRIEFIAFSLILAITINSVFIYLVVLPLYDYYEKSRIDREWQFYKNDYNKYWDEKMGFKKNKSIEEKK